MFPVVAAVAAGYVLLRGSRRNPRRRRRNPGERTVSDEALADAKLTRRVLKQVRDEINGSDREAYNHWMVISERTRNYYRDAAGEPRSNPLSVKRSADFQDFGTYDVTLNDGGIVQISRDAGNTNWWYIQWSPLHYTDQFLGFTKAEALKTVDDWVARRLARHPGEVAKYPGNIRRTNPRRRRKSRR